ncbi:MAG: MucR family transcriptional regulator [Geobacter sp.]|nr:MucR family transcriptional regulator [Geobacter sp.]
MATITELVAEIVSAHASTTPMTTEQLLEELQKVTDALKALEAGREVDVTGEGGGRPAISIKDAFKKNEVVCMVCGKGGFKTLTRHLNQSHNMKPREYRKQFGLPGSQSLSAKSFSEARRKMAQDRGLADKLVKAREVRAANLAAKKAKVVKPSAKTKAEKPQE